VIIGHEKILNFFEKAIENDQLAHAYCFAGPQKVGKKTVALKIAKDILKTENLDSNPDFFLLEREINEKTGKLKKEISVAQARKLRGSLQNSSWSVGGYKIVVIDEAEKLNEESANALLKSLEEPNQKIIFFLLTTDEEGMLDTVKSRCQIFNFTLVEIQKIRDYLKDKKDIDEESILKYSEGRPGVVVEMIENLELGLSFKEADKFWSGLINKQVYEIFGILEKHLKEKKEGIDGVKNLSGEIDIWVLSLRKKMLVEPSQKIQQIIDVVLEVKNNLNKNINPKLLLENLFLQIK